MAISTIGVSQNKPNIELDSMFVNNPELTLYAINNSYESARLFQKEIELNERLDAYRKKKHNHQITGGSIGLLGLGGLWYTAEMHDPIYQVGNDEINKLADEQKNKRAGVAITSSIFLAVGTYIFIDSYKFDKRGNWEIDLQEMKVKRSIYGFSRERDYFNGKKSDLKSKMLYRKYID